MKNLWQLYSAFFRIGLLTFGGGYAMLPMLEKEVVAKHGWVTREDLLDYFAIGQILPGIIAANTASLVGYRQGKTAGSVTATLGVVTPSLIIIMIIAAVLENFMEIPEVIHAFAGIRVAVCALIVAAGIKLFRSNVLQKAKGAAPGAGPWLARNAIPLLLCAVAFVMVSLLKWSPIIVVVAAGITGLLFYGKRGEAR